MHFSLFQFKKKAARWRPSRSSGFSLIELVVVIAIFLILSLVVLFNQNKFSSEISISNFAYNVALDVRKAQAYGLLVREQVVGAGFDSGYGVRFYKSGSVIQARFFADSNNDGIYSNSSESIGIFDFEEGNIVSNVCTTVCLLSSTSTQASYVDIVFKRPDPDASIRDSSSPTTKRSDVVITVQSALGDRTRGITVVNTGQISVQ